MAMGYFKKKNLISKIILLYLFLIFCNSCNLKEIKIEESKLMNTNIQTQKFDIEKYESNLKTNPLYEGYQKDERIFVKQFHTIKDGYIEETYTKTLVENYYEQYISDDRFETFYKYDAKGILLSVSHYFADNVQIGKWKYYENGNLIKTEDKDIGYSFDIYKVIKYGKDNKVDFNKTGEIIKSSSPKFSKNVWELNWNTGTFSEDDRSLFRSVILDGNNGNVLSKSEYYINPLHR